MTPKSPDHEVDLVARLSFTHIAELMVIPDLSARMFYETECIRGGWFVRELKRQIASLYFERSALSRDKNKLAARTQKGADKAPSRLDIKDPYIFEFLGLKSEDVMGESHLEDQLNLPKPAQLRRRMERVLREERP